MNIDKDREINALGRELDEWKHTLMTLEHELEDCMIPETRMLIREDIASARRGIDSIMTSLQELGEA